MTERLSCSVDGCKSTTAEPWTGWICPKHWRLLTKAERRVWHRIRRISRRHGWDVLDPSRVNRIWFGLVRRASL